MKTFIITETRPATATWTYKVKAENETAALAKIFDEYEINENPELTYEVDMDADMHVDIKETE